MTKRKRIISLILFIQLMTISSFQVSTTFQTINLANRDYLHLSIKQQNYDNKDKETKLYSTSTSETTPKKKKTTTASLFNNDIARTLQRLTSPLPSSSSDISPSQQPPHVKKLLSAAKKAEDMLYHMYKLYTQYNRQNAKPNADTYKLIMNAYLKIGGYTWLDEDEETEDSKTWICIVDKLEELYHHYHVSLGVDEEEEAGESIEIFNCLLKGYASCAHLHRNKPLSQQTSLFSHKTERRKNDSYRKHGGRDEVTYAERAESRLHDALHEKENCSPSLKPNSESFKYAIQAYTRQQPFADKIAKWKKWNKHQKNDNNTEVEAKCLDRAFSILTYWASYFSSRETTTQEECLDTLSSHYKLLQAYSKMNTIEYADMGEKLLEQMEKIHDEIYFQWDDEKKDVYTNSVQTDVRVRNSDNEVEPLLDREKPIQVYPNAESYTLVLLSFNKISKQRQQRQEDKIAIAERAQNLLQKMMTRYLSYTDAQKIRFGEPKLIAFNNVMTCWSNCIIESDNAKIKKVNEMCAEQASDVLDWMDELSGTASFAKEENEQERDEEMVFLTPNVVSYNTILQAYAKLVPTHSFYDEGEKGEDHPIENVQHIRDKMDRNKVSPDDYTYNILLHAWSKCSAIRAEKILVEMEKRYVSSLQKQPNEDREENEEDMGVTTRRVKKSLKGKNNKINPPSIRHYTAVISAWAKFTDASDNHMGIQRALSLLNQMGKDNYPLAQHYDTNEKVREKQYRGSDNCDNDTSVYFQRPQPDLITYSTIMDILADNNHVPNKGKIASILLDKIEAAEMNNFSPGQNRRQQQLDLLTERVYVSAIKTIANEQQVDGPQRAWDILQRLIRRRNGISSSFGYNHVINSAAISNAKSSSDKTLHFQIALRAFQELRQGKNLRREDNSSDISPPSPDSFTYAYFVKACCILLPPSKSRSEIIFKALEECVDDGYLSEEVWRRLMDGLSKEEMKDILISLLPSSVVKEQQAMVDMLYLGDLRVMDLPRQWSSNAESSRKNRGGGTEWSFNL